MDWLLMRQQKYFGLEGFDDRQKRQYGARYTADYRFRIGMLSKIIRLVCIQPVL